MELIALIIILILAIYGIYAGIIAYLNKRKKQDKIDFKPHMDIDFESIKEKDLDTLKLEELRKIYIQLIDVENKIDKSNQYLKDINSCTNLIVFCIVAPIIIGIILKLIGVNILSGIL